MLEEYERQAVVPTSLAIHARFPRPTLSRTERTNTIRFCAKEYFVPSPELWEETSGLVIGVPACKPCGAWLFDGEHCVACSNGSIRRQFDTIVDGLPRFQLQALSTIHDGPVVSDADRESRVRIPTAASDNRLRVAVEKDGEERWSMRELLENGKFVHGASKANRLLRLTTVQMHAGVVDKANDDGKMRGWRPDDTKGATSTKMEGRTTAFVDSAEDNNAALQFYITTPEGDGPARRREAAVKKNQFGGPIDGDLVNYVGAVLAITHRDVQNVVQALADDSKCTNVKISLDVSNNPTAGRWGTQKCAVLRIALRRESML